jgi:hypothetical protein
MLMVFLWVWTNLIFGQILVNAGQDQTICNSDTLVLSELNSSISGIVSNGYWFTNGDGTFAPQQQFNRYNITTKYIPGAADKAAGFVNLVLVSDDPDGVGPQVQVTDQVKITFMGNIAILCNSNLNVSLGDDCTQQMTASMLAANLQQPAHYYTLTLKNSVGQPIPNNTLTRENIGKIVEYKIGHKCGTNSCWGLINVQDKVAPTLNCKNVSVFCGDSTDVAKIGLPLPATATSLPNGTNKFIVNNLDACGIVTLTYTDSYQAQKCTDNLQAKIFRTWSAVDEFSNRTNCIQQIDIKLRTLDEVVLPLNFDDIATPSLLCNGNWAKLPNGYPSPSVTGSPILDGCSNLEATYQDSKFGYCGASYNVLRKWTLINWCGNKVREHNQIIQVRDIEKPNFTCPSALKLYTDYTSCYTGKEKLPYPSNIVDCSSTKLEVRIKEKFANGDFTHQITVDTGGISYINGLPLGTYHATYYIIDACGNKDSCIADVTVEDKIAPIAVCDQNTVISLTASGTGRLHATSVDDGSFDNCKVANLKIAKTTDKCGSLPMIFGDYVDFCCNDVSDTLMVILRVTDNFGNSNSCMVNVKVQDKIAPSIFCPSNITVSCKESIDTSKLNIFGTIGKGSASIKELSNIPNLISPAKPVSGYYLDNCDGDIVTEYTLNLKCNIGSILRTFTVTDKGKNTRSCTQVITLSDPDPMDSLDIAWPSYIELPGCDTTAAASIKSGNPTYKNINCAQPAATYKDIVFKNIEGACIKILRQWTVIDWCQFNEVNNKGRWNYTQVIKIFNTGKPQFIAPCRDSLLCLFAENCAEETFKYQPAVSDDCTSASNIKATWKVDKGNNGTIDAIGDNRELSIKLGVGKHKIFYTIIDDCDNKTTCEFIVEGKDCKRPTPYCLSDVATVVMPTTGSLALKAIQFNKNSFDNCTALNELRYSFTSEVKDSSKIFTCKDLDKGVGLSVPIRMYVFDKNNNFEYCSINIVIQDNSDVCQDTELKGAISGNLIAPDFQTPISNSEIFISEMGSLMTSKDTTGSEGIYEVKDAIVGNQYVVKPYKKQNLEEGLATNDLILIQRHILGVVQLNDPYKVIAADMDYNGRVNITDLVILRKIILGSSSTMPNNRPNYTFVPKNYEFIDKNKPGNFPDSLTITDLKQGMNNGYDFIAIKKGDINLNGYQLLNQGAENRNNSKVSILLKKSAEVTKITLNEAISTSGLQLKFRAGRGVKIEIPAELKDVMFIEEKSGVYTVILLPTSPISAVKGQVLCKVWDNHLTVDESLESSTIYSDEVEPIGIRIGEEQDLAEGLIIEHVSRQSMTVLNQGELTNNLDIKVFDKSGRVVHFIKNIDFQSGVNIIPFEAYLEPDLYFITIYKNGKVVTATGRFY